MLESIPREALLGCAAAACLWALLVTVRTWLRRLRMRCRFARGAAGERDAIVILEREGFVIEAAQVAGSYELAVDRSRVVVPVRADYLVVRNGTRWVAEVKTGRLAPRIETPATRRQLLEYQLAFGAAGVILVDADDGTLRTVVFDLGTERPRSVAVPWVLAALAVAVAAIALRGL
jgi:Holliday junction resolvase